MAIITKHQLPLVLRLNDDNPLKMHIISQLGYPNVAVELQEPQFEQVLRSTGDFIAQYFPLQERYAYFMTVPLQNEYNIPEDAYWIRQVAWDPATTRISDIFGAESFLFCYGGGSILLTNKGPKPIEECYEDKKIKLITPFGLRKPKMRWNKKQQPITMLRTKEDFLCCTPNHPVSCNEKFIMASSCKIGDYLINSNDQKCKIIDIHTSKAEGTWSIQNSSGSLYIGAQSNEFYLSH